MYEEIGGQKVYLKYSECEEGQVLCEGIYKRQGIDKTYGKPYWEVQDEEKGLVHLNHAGQLEIKFEELKVGDQIQVTFMGKQRIEKGPYAGKDANQFKVLRAKREQQDSAEDKLSGNIEDDFDAFGI